MRRRFLEIINGVARNEVISDGTFDPATIPAGRLIIDVTDLPSASIGDTVTVSDPTATLLIAGPGVVFAKSVAVTRGKPVSRMAFMRILTPAEYAAFVAAGATDPIMTYAKAMLDASVSLSSDETTFRQVLGHSVQIGIFSQARADAIVAAMNS